MRQSLRGEGKGKGARAYTRLFNPWPPTSVVLNLIFLYSMVSSLTPMVGIEVTTYGPVAVSP